MSYDLFKVAFSIGTTNFGGTLSSFNPKGMHLSLVILFFCLYFHNSTYFHFLIIGYRKGVKFH
jgi:hypothetical protein